MPLGASVYTPIQERGGPFDGWGAIHIAAWRGDVSILNTLIDNGIDISLLAHQNEVFYFLICNLIFIFNHHLVLLILILN